MKRLLCAVLAAVLLTGCGVKQDEKTIPADSIWTEWDTPLTETLLDGVSSLSGEIRLSAGQKDELPITFWRLLCAHPELFFVNGEYRCTVSGDTLLFSPSYTMPPSEAFACSEALDAAAEKLLSGVSETLSIKDRALLLHDRLIRALSYDEKHTSPLLDALLAGRADCEGYARAYQYLLQKAGIPALYVTGEANGSGHAWVMFADEAGFWYHVDPTWDDGEDFISRAYFMLNDRIISRTHTAVPAVSGGAYPACEGEAYPFFKERNLCLADDAGQKAAVRRAFDEAAASETGAAEFCFPDGVSLHTLSALDPLVQTEAERRGLAVFSRITAKNSYVVSYRIEE